MRKLLLIGAGGIAALVLAVVVIGLLLPAEHEASRSIFIPRGAREIWETVTRWRDLKEWRTGVKRARRLDDRRGWVEIGESGELPLEIVKAVPPNDLVLEIAGDLPFSGTWTYAIRPVASGAGCNVTITERGRVDNPVFRFVSRVFLDERASMTTYLTDLAHRFGEEPRFIETPVEIPESTP